MMMMYPIPSCLLVIVLVCVVRASGFGSGTTMKRASQDFRGQHRSDPTLQLFRQVRSIPEDNPCVTITYLTELKNRFVRSLDHNNDGTATFGEVKDYMRRFKSNVKDEAVEAFIRRRDTNGNRAIDFIPEYVHDMSVPDYTIGGATEWFHLHDINDDGFVADSELMNATQALDMSPDQAVEVVQGYYMAADLNGDGKLSFDEFKTLYDQ